MNIIESWCGSQTQWSMMLQTIRSRRNWNEVEKLFVALQQPRSMSELGWTNPTQFKAKYLASLIDNVYIFIF